MNDRWEQGVLRHAGRETRGPAAAPLVIKIGGSLLARPAWPDELIALVSSVSNPGLLVVGGGRIVDALRRIDATAPRPAAVMHRLAIEALGLSARLVADALGLPLVRASRDTERLAVLDTPFWLDTTEAGSRRFDRLPVGWHVTSDSIAAFVAATGRSPLLLAKSGPPPGLDAGSPIGSHGDADLETIASTGWIDGYFPTAAAPLGEIRWAAPRFAVSPTTSVGLPRVR